jgi:hypothetical protein
MLPNCWAVGCTACSSIANENIGKDKFLITGDKTLRDQFRRQAKGIQMNYASISCSLKSMIWAIFSLSCPPRSFQVRRGFFPGWFQWRLAQGSKLILCCSQWDTYCELITSAPNVAIDCSSQVVDFPSPIVFPTYHAYCAGSYGHRRAG